MPAARGTKAAAQDGIDSLTPAWVWSILAGVTILYFALALAYARATPAWQAPDEPAHYNYVQFLAQHGQLPVLQPGDYPAKLVPLAPNQRVSDITPFRYESHQPPLFYALEAAVYDVSGGRLMALRALSGLFGALLVPITFLCARLALPRQPWLQLGAAAFVAFIPMHLFIAGAVENDSLADLVVSLLLLAYLALASGWLAAKGKRRWPFLGLLLGAALLTKVTIYLPAAALVLGCWLLSWRREGRLAAIRAAVITFGMALIVAGWWFVRNGLTYGWTDLLAQGRQQQVAAGQLQTGGPRGFDVARFVHTSFDSFWGQFGWMTIPLPQRDYLLLLVLTALVAAGLLASFRRPALFQRMRRSMWLGLGLTFVAVLAGDVDYNLTFVQPQGRYVFPALVPLGLFVVYGLAALVPKRLQPVIMSALSCGMLAFALLALRQDLIPSFAA